MNLLFTIRRLQIYSSTSWAWIGPDGKLNKFGYQTDHFHWAKDYIKKFGIDVKDNVLDSYGWMFNNGWIRLVIYNDTLMCEFAKNSISSKAANTLIRQIEKIRKVPNFIIFVDIVDKGTTIDTLIKEHNINEAATLIKRNVSSGAGKAQKRINRHILQKRLEQDEKGWA